MNVPAIAMPKIGANQDLAKTMAVAIPAISIAISLGIAFLIVWPKFNEVLALRKANQEMIAKAEDLEGKAQALRGLDKNLLTRQLLLAEQLLPSDKNVFTFLSKIENAALVSGVLLEKVDVSSDSINESTTAQSAASAAAGIKSNITEPSVEISLSVSSSYSSLLQFMSSILSTSRVVRIEDLSVASSKGESSAISTSFKVKAYWRPLPQDLGSIESGLEKLNSEEAQLLDKVQQTSVSTPEVTLPAPPLGRSDLFTPF